MYMLKTMLKIFLLVSKYDVVYDMFSKCDGGINSNTTIFTLYNLYYRYMIL